MAGYDANGLEISNYGRVKYDLVTDEESSLVELSAFDFVGDSYLIDGGEVISD